MAVESLRTHLIEELTDLLDAENQLTKALPRMAKSATTPVLRTAFERHLQETRVQIDRLDRALRQLGERPRRKTCEAMQGLLAEGEEVMNKTPPGALRDAVMITSAQKVEHYEIASYGTARTYAEVLGERGVARLLAQTLREEKATDGKLTVIAERSVNEDAAEEWRSLEEAGILERSSAWMGEAISAASRRLTGSRGTSTGGGKGRKTAAGANRSAGASRRGSRARRA